jgi:hypothetical protein
VNSRLMSGLMFASVTWEQSALLVLIIALFVAVAALTVGNISKPQRWRFRPSYRPVRFNQLNVTDAGQQLNAVMAASFEKRRVLSKPEYRVFAIVENVIEAHGAGHRVLAQTSLGQILRSSYRDAFQAINSKRVDILVIDRFGWPVLAVEYQGNGHYQGTAAARDAVKKEALRKAGVRYIEFNTTDTDDQIRSRLREHLASKGRSTNAPANHPAAATPSGA